ncbi:MAG: efflux RND transporter periplasmic adaptor subunit [Gemmatimonadota bacterium]|nr:efflux RND transporter periplasmic adaptor subunit [Gemmatimonadota bacterium]
MRAITTTMTVLLLMSACRSTDDEASPMAGMTAEEHARMQAGGTQGATDSMGTMLRQAVQLTTAQEQALGVTYTTVSRGSLERTIRTVGRIEVAEPNVVDVSPKIDGFVERLMVSSTGAPVRRGQALLTLYSPQLVAAQEDLLTARRMLDRLTPESGEPWSNAETMVQAARRRLEYWDITTAQIDEIEQSRQVSKALTLVAPATGVVLTKNVTDGQRVMLGDLLYRIADLREVWVEGDVFEQDLQFIRPGAQAHIEVSAYPSEHIMGRVSFVYPTVEQESRTNRVRVTVPNADLRLKPGMFATIFFDVTIGTDALTVPLGAVIVTGERNLVFVRHDDGTLMPHQVVLGARARNRVVILQGVSAGETIVASANFLVDAESRLATTGGAMPGMQHAEHGAVLEPDTTSPEHRHD